MKQFQTVIFNNDHIDAATKHVYGKLLELPQPKKYRNSHKHTRRINSLSVKLSIRFQYLLLKQN